MLKSLALYYKLTDLLRQQKSFLLIGVLASLLAAAIDAGLAATLEPLINQGFSSQLSLSMTLIGFIVIGTMTVRALMFFCSDYSLSRVSRGIVRSFRGQLFQHIAFLPQQFFKQHASSKLIAMMTFNIEQMASAATDALVTVFREGFKALGLLAVMFYTSWQLSCLFLVIAPILAMIGRYSSRRMRQLGHDVQETVADLTHVTKEAVEAHDLIKVYEGYSQEINRVKLATQANYSREMRLVTTGSMATALIQIVASLPLAVIMMIAMGGSLGLTAGSFSALVAAMLMLLPSINRLTRVNATLQKGLASANVVFDVLSEKQEDLKVGCLDIKSIQPLIFNDVSFGYDHHERQVINHLSFTVVPGETVAIVGPSGVGKSTIISLILRFINPNAGEIYLGDTPVNTTNLKQYRQLFSYVGQDVHLFSDTIACNVAYGASNDAISVRQALTMASALDFVDELPDAENSRIGYRGYTLSGGQKQRIAIARAFMRQAPFLILDEATSALDNHSEREIQQVLDHLMTQSTTIVIAHRLSTVQNADKIIVLGKEGVIESGTHEELMHQASYYADLYHVSNRPVCAP